MTEGEIIQFIRDELDGIVVVTASAENGAPEAAWGHSFFFYDPTDSIPEDRRMPFATIVTSDYEGFDTSSHLNREGVFRLNMWVSRETMGSRFSPDEEVDPTVLDRIIPHPVYAAQSWVSVLNPGDASTADAIDLLREAHAGAKRRWERKAGRD
jgi:hypothetical protein